MLSSSGEPRFSPWSFILTGMNPGWRGIDQPRRISWGKVVYTWYTQIGVYISLYCGALNTALTVFHSLRPFLSARLRLVKIQYLQRSTLSRGIHIMPAHWQALVHRADSTSGASTNVAMPSSKLHHRSEPYGIVVMSVRVILSRASRTSLRGWVVNPWSPRQASSRHLAPDPGMAA
jgi:hypothetical protein